MFGLFQSYIFSFCLSFVYFNSISIMLVSSCSVHAVVGVIKISYVVILVLPVDWESLACLVTCS